MQASRLHALHLPRLRSAARFLGLPALLAACLAAMGAAIWFRASLELTSLAILFGAIGYLFLLERMIPFRGAWQPSWRELRRDGIYFGLNGAIGWLVAAFLGVLSIHLARDTRGLPLIPEILLGYLLATFLGYWVHRWEHRQGALWSMHGIHHRPRKLNVTNNNVIHFLDLIFQNGPPLAALVWLGFSPEAVLVAHSFGQVAGFANHANADFRLGPLNYLIGGPEQHRLHHSADIREAGHFSPLPAWDLVFGTFRWRPGQAPVQVGMVRSGEFPPAESIAASALHPLRLWMGQRRER
jgi:sterol desaturase/sphingolipid hydroxylase (fatty acid hydroxylase superfamily)